LVAEGVSRTLGLVGSRHRVATFFCYAPKSWLINEPEKKFRRLSAGAALVRLQHIGARQEIPMQLPQTKGGAVPYLTVDGAVKAAEFYKKAFAAEVAHIVPPDEKGRTMHAHVYINGGSVMMSDAYPEHGHPLREPAGFNVTLPVEDVDAWYDRAVKAGCTAVMPPTDMFWGDRYSQLKDPFGVLWAINGPVKKK
jgi:PhnB protein